MASTDPAPDKELSALLSGSQKPLLIKNLTSDWPCSKWNLTDWASVVKEPLTFRYSSVNEECQYEYETKKFNATFKDFEEAVERGSFSSPPLFLKDTWVYSSYNWMKNLKISKPGCLNWTFFDPTVSDCSTTTLWLGTRGAFTPCHKDSYGLNLVAQLIGSKEWILFPPEDSELLYQSRIPYEETSTFSKIDFSRPVDLGVFPRFAEATPHRVVLQPGDVLLVPKHWWHFVRCLDTSVSVNRWFDIQNHGDAMDKLEEAIAALMVPRMDDLFEDRVVFNGEKEVEVDPDVILNAIRKSLEELGKRQGECTTGVEDKRRNCGSFEVIEVPRCSLETVNRDSTKRPKVEITTDDIAECILDPDVIRLIAKKIASKFIQRTL